MYDLIPYIYKKHYLKDQKVARWYFNKLDHLRRADLLLSISESSGREAIEFLGFSNDDVVNISAACDNKFRPLSVNDLDYTYLSQVYGITRPFVMYAGDIDERKNVDGLLRAYARLPSALRETHCIVMVGRELEKQRDRFMRTAQEAGLRKDEVIFTGYVSDDDLVSLYNLCALFVFPSWHEGFGLPVLEAMACGRAVIAANSSSLPEVVGRKDALFTPRDDTALAEKMAEVLSNPQFRQELERHGLEQAKKFSWDATARRAWHALEALHSRHQARKTLWVSQQPTRRPRLAFVSPLPPERSRIADYSAELLPELARHYDITIIAAQDRVDVPWVQANVSVRDVAWLRAHAHRFDRVLYHFGNSVSHAHMFDLLA
ncbi:MAG: glycosyltransferase family 4 protein, partial [Geopsychrobacter sp.]|nr:glycosyltransferase family 4 protein [Geopsychrobacter sp.]